MKYRTFIRPTTFSLIAAFVLMIVHSKPGRADEDRPSKKHALKFLKEKLPDSFKLLKGEETREEDSEILEMAGDLLGEYLEIKREDGAEEAEAFLKEERPRIRLEIFVEAWRANEDGEERGALKKEIAKIIGDQIDRELADGQRELEELEEEVEKLGEELADIEENRDAIIAEELADLLSEEKGDEDEKEARGGKAEAARGNYEFSITQSWSQEKNFKRPYFVHVPKREHAPVRDPLPIVIYLHGNGGNAERARNGFLRRYPKLASHCISVFPDGYKESWNIVSERSKADDLKFIEAVVGELEKNYDVRDGEFTIIGVSNGAALANQIAIESKLTNIKNYITAVSPLNGFQHDGENFKVRGDDNDYRKIAKPLPGKRLLNISGTDDRLVPYRGGPSSAIPAKGGKLPFVHAEESIFLWAKQMGFEGEKLTAPSEKRGEIDIFSYLDGDIVHLKVNGKGHNATGAISEALILEFLRGGEE